MASSYLISWAKPFIYLLFSHENTKEHRVLNRAHNSNPFRFRTHPGLSQVRHSRFVLLAESRSICYLHNDKPKVIKENKMLTVSLYDM